MTYRLYSTDGCHLCDDAKRLLNAAKVAYQEVDILDDETWTEKYKYTIPVVEHLASENTIAWPFDPYSLQQFINANE